MTDTRVRGTERRKVVRPERVPPRVDERVNDAVKDDREAYLSPAERARMHTVEAELRTQAVREAEQRQRLIHRARIAARVSQFVDFAFSIVYALLGLRLVLALIAARSTSGFVIFLRTITDPLYAPFRGIVPSPSTEGGGTLVWPLVIAVVVYAMLHTGLTGLLRMVGSRKAKV